jgi:hypothetical protein
VSFYKDKGLVRDKSRESRVFVRDWKWVMNQQLLI